MGFFENYGCVLGLLFWANAVTLITADDISSQGAKSSSDREHSRPSLYVSVPHASQPDTLGDFLTLSLSTAFPEDMEYCVELLRVFGQRYVTLANCLVSSALPVTVCQNCKAGYKSFQEIYANISSDQTDSADVRCQETLLHSNRLMLLSNLYSSVNDLWDSAACAKCLTNDMMSLSNDTLNFFASFNQSLTCFEKFQQGNHTELCKECKTTYKKLNELYSEIATNKKLCIDIEDAMNRTWHLWSRNFSCSFQHEETVPVMALSGFMLFLPIIFYLSNYLHSEQKKRKLIQPKRAKSSHSLGNIQEKFS